MRIGIDAKWYFTGNISGRIVVTNLLQQIGNLPADHHYIIILDAKDRDKLFPFAIKNNFEVVYQKAYTNQLANILSPFFLKKYRLDVCVYQYFSPFFSNYKRVVYIHDIIFESNPEFFPRKERLYFKLMKWMARRAHGVVTVSKTEEKRLRKFGYIHNGTQLKSIYNGIANKFYDLRDLRIDDISRIEERYCLPKKFVLYVGRINERKNVPLLMEAMANVDDGVKLVIAGEKHWSKSNLDHLISKNGLNDKIHFTGFVREEDIQTLYRIARAFCFLSFDEGFGLPVAEAMASGIPVIVSDIAVHREICGDAAFYVNPNDANEVAKTINFVLAQPDLVQANIERGLEISKKYRWQYAAKSLIDFLEQV